MESVLCDDISSGSIGFPVPGSGALDCARMPAIAKNPGSDPCTKRGRSPHFGPYETEPQASVILRGPNRSHPYRASGLVHWPVIVLGERVLATQSCPTPRSALGKVADKTWLAIDPTSHRMWPFRHVMCSDSLTCSRLGPNRYRYRTEQRTSGYLGGGREKRRMATHGL